MNNSFIVLDSKESLVEEPQIDRTPWLRQREGELVKIIEAIDEISNSESWQVLKSFIFDGVIETLEKAMLTEAKGDKADVVKLASLNGQFNWAKKYADLGSLTKVFKIELQGIRKQLNKNHGE